MAQLQASKIDFYAYSYTAVTFIAHGTFVIMIPWPKQELPFAMSRSFSFHLAVRDPSCKIWIVAQRSSSRATTTSVTLHSLMFSTFLVLNHRLLPQQETMLDFTILKPCGVIAT